MSFRDNLLNASFKGASFKVMNSDYEIGRRTSVHQYANRDKPYVQDHGRQLDGFVIEAYVVQNIDNFYNYFAERDALIAALKSKGPGQLIHPFLGIKKVQVIEKVRITETFEKQGIATFRIMFLEAGERALPEAIEDFLANMDNAVNQAFDLVGDYFSQAYNTVGAFLNVSQNAVNRSTELVQLGLASVQNISTQVINQTLQNTALIKNLIGDHIETGNDVFNILKDVPASFGIICGMGALVEEEANNTAGTTKQDSLDINTSTRNEDVFINKLLIDAEVVGGSEGDYSGITRGMPTKLDGDVISNDIGVSVLKAISDSIENFDISTFGAIPDEQQNNVALIFDIFKFANLAFASRIGVRIDFNDKDELISWMNIIADRMDEVLTEYGTEAADGPYGIGIGQNPTDPVDNSSLFSSLKDIRNVFVESMIAKAGEFATLIDFTVPTDNLSAVSLAYEKYEDITRYKEIYNNNKTKTNHPGFLPSGDDIRILNE
jgi:prophage DNA circulation protein